MRQIFSTTQNIILVILTEIDRCYPNPCKNGGSCTDGDKDHTCKCTPGWKGKNCMISKWLNNLTYDAKKIILCDCFCVKPSPPTQIIILVISIEIDHCDSNPCYNGATCTDGDKDYTCKCNPGWEGKKCTESK